jgi:hypothetical protein
LKQRNPTKTQETRLVRSDLRFILVETFLVSSSKQNNWLSFNFGLLKLHCVGIMVKKVGKYELGKSLGEGTFGK